MTTATSPGYTSLLSSISPFANTTKARLQALYSDFSRQKQSNPTAYNANVEWWRKALEAIVSSGFQDQQNNTTSRLVLRANGTLLDSLRVEKAGKPLALGAVINELQSNKALIPIDEFMNAKISIYNAAWLPYRIASFVIGKPLWWALEQAGIVGDEGLLSPRSQTSKEVVWWGDYVFVKLLERAAEAVLSLQQAKMTGPADTLYTLDGFRKAFASVFGDSTQSLNEMDARVLLKYLERERNLIVWDHDVIKFVNETTSPDEAVITAVDRGLLELKTATLNMQIQIENIQERMDQCKAKATTALQQKRKPLALSYLKSRKQLEDLLSKKLGSMSTLESTLLSIETAADDIKLMKTYESSTITLRSVLAHPSLQRDNIEKTMDALAEASPEAHEIDDAVRIAGNVALGADDLDEAELEGELAALAKDVQAEASKFEETQQRLESLKTPPMPVELDSQLPEKQKVALSS